MQSIDQEDKNNITQGEENRKRTHISRAGEI
jgi:hypothetical protein